MLIRWLGAEDTQYNRECSRLLFAGGINRAFRPGCKNDNVIVFVGKQGGGKSTFTQWLALAPELYSSTKTINGQKGLEAISGKPPPAQHKSTLRTMEPLRFHWIRMPLQQRLKTSFLLRKADSMMGLHFTVS